MTRKNCNNTMAQSLMTKNDHICNWVKTHHKIQAMDPQCSNANFNPTYACSHINEYIIYDKILRLLHIKLNDCSPSVSADCCPWSSDCICYKAIIYEMYASNNDSNALLPQKNTITVAQKSSTITILTMAMNGWRQLPNDWLLLLHHECVSRRQTVVSFTSQ